MSERSEGDDASIGLQKAMVPLDAGALHPDVDVLAAADQHAPCWQNADAPVSQVQKTFRLKFKFVVNRIEASRFGVDSSALRLLQLGSLSLTHTHTVCLGAIWRYVSATELASK